MDSTVWMSGVLALAGRRATYGDFVAAVRQYRSFVSGPDAGVEVWSHPDGTRLIPGVATEGAVHQTRMEAAFTAVQLVAQDQETVNKAHLLSSIPRRVAVARAVHGAGRVPSDLDESLFAAEHDFPRTPGRARRALDEGVPQPIRVVTCCPDLQAIAFGIGRVTPKRASACPGCPGSQCDGVAVRPDLVRMVGKGSMPRQWARAGRGTVSAIRIVDSAKRAPCQPGTSAASASVPRQLSAVASFGN